MNGSEQQQVNERAKQTIAELVAEKPNEVSDKDIQGAFDKAKLDELEAANKYRKTLVKSTTRTVTGLVTTATAFMGFYLFVQRGHIEASVMIAYFASVVAEVVGILYVIARYLFPSPTMPNQIVVAGAVICESTVLVAQRLRPPELAGRWELPGGKVAVGETEPDALARELAEELGVEVAVGERLGEDISLDATTTLGAYRVTLIRGEPHPHDHGALRWVTAAELHDIDWVPADRRCLGALNRALELQ